MKKYLLIVAVLFGLQTQAQFISNPCDSVDVSLTLSVNLYNVDLEATSPSSSVATSWNWVSVSNSLNQVDTTQIITIAILPIIVDTTYVTLTMTVLDSSGMMYTCVKSYLVFFLSAGGYGILPAGQSVGNTVITVGPGGLGAMSPHCDSINIVADPMSTSTNVILNADASTLPGTVNAWYWDVYDYNGFVQSSLTQSVNFTASTTDTLMVFLETTIDINGSPFICLHFGSVYYDVSNWVFTSAYLPVGPTNPGGGSTGGGGIGNTFAICDSLSIAINPSATYANPVLNVNVSNTAATVLANQWQAFDNNGNFYADSTLLFSFTNTAPSDTIAVFVMATIPYNGIVASCMLFDMLVFNNGGWVSMRVGGGTTGIENINSFLENRKLVKVVDVLGRETKGVKNTPLFYIYNDGTVEQKMIVE
tara:strand:- start:267 stop:1526 length:1260 start_codon:yes stop_codon:yes gene_type:complete